MAVRIKFVLILLGALVISDLLRRTAYSVWLFAMATLPGTFLHELAHYVSAFILGGDPQDFNLIPIGTTLGSISFRPTWFNTATVSLSPLLLAPLTVWIAAKTARSNNPLKIVGGSYLAACSWVACLPSSVDIALALHYPSSWPIAGSLLGISVLTVYKMTRKILRS